METVGVGFTINHLLQHCDYYERALPPLVLHVVGDRNERRALRITSTLDVNVLQAPLIEGGDRLMQCKRRASPRLVIHPDW
jgi:hypothetical protein